MDTSRLYYEDAHLREFDAVVISCQPEKSGWIVVLDRTAFYPEGGGQPGDTGMLGAVRVTDTQVRGDAVVHFCDAPLECGAAVHGVLDWERRFDLMQLHSGEHIVSGIIHRRFGYENVGFHMGAEMVTIDFSGMLNWEQLREVEREANEAVWANTPVEIRNVDGEEKAQAVYRSKKELPGTVRLVTFPGKDTCACCGTHVARTGEIGLIKIFSCQKFHEGVRLEMLCGRRALVYVNSILEQNKQVSNLLSAKPQQTAAAVERTLEELAQTKYRAGALEQRIIAREAQTLAGAGDALLFMELSADGLRQMADAGMRACGGVCAVFCGSDEAGWRYAIGQAGGDLRAFGKSLNAALSGRGGGKQEFLQGSVQATRTQIEAFWKEMRTA